MFDKVIKPNASQEKVYNDAARTIVKGKGAVLCVLVCGWEVVGGWESPGVSVIPEKFC